MSETKTTKTEVASKKKKVEATQKDAIATTKVNKKATAVDEKSPLLDRLIWLVAFALIFLAIGGNFYYARYVVVDETSLMRLGRVAVVVLVIAAAFVTALFTNRGKKTLAFAKEAYIELRKVVWPTRQEALQTTLIVFVAVCIVSLFLYLSDLVFLQVVRAITL